MQLGQLGERPRGGAGRGAARPAMHLSPDDALVAGGVFDRVRDVEIEDVNQASPSRSAWDELVAHAVANGTCPREIKTSCNVAPLRSGAE